MTVGMLLSATYSNGKAILKFYDQENNKLITWNDNTGHLPHCYVTSDTAIKLKEISGIVNMSEVDIFDVIKDKQVKMTQVVANNPLVIGGSSGIREIYNTWESDIKYYQTYLYDTNLIVGKWYNIGDKITPVNQSDNQINLNDINTDSVIEIDKFKKQFLDWAQLLDEPIPNIRRLAFDIEVETTNGMPDPLVAGERVTAISFESHDIHKVFVLKRPEIPMGKPEPDNKGITLGGIPHDAPVATYPYNYTITWYDSEKKLLEDAFMIIESYPIVLTYNGDMFDMPYLFNRATKLGIKNTPFKMMAKNATLTRGVHIDMYGVFSNRSLKIYAFKAKYVEDSLNAVSEALLGERKTEYTGDLQQIPLYLLARYCYNDSRLTYKLSSYNNNLVMNLLIILCRLGNMPIDDISRLSISNWIKSMLYFKHRQNNELIPKLDDFPKVEASTTAMIEGKKYEGAIVLEPKKGIHFDVTVMDFASLYPSIIKTKNISYETVCCPHIECKTNMVPFTKHWACTKKSGVVSLLIGALKELRVGHFKKLSKTTKDEKKKQQYETISESLKVFLNASYGVIGFENFPLYYLPTAEAVTAYGRSIITDTVKTAKETNMDVIYGDTDSIFIKKPTKEQIDNLIDYADKTFSIDLEQDKNYRYVILSNLRKNYFGIKQDGAIDIKGLTGKKSNTPPFVRNLFSNITNELKKIEVIEQFEPTKKTIESMVKDIVTNMEKIPLKDMAFTVKIQKDPSEYKVKPQAIKAAEQLANKPNKGQFISFIKTWNEPGVKPLTLADKSDIDKDKYLEVLETTISQITNSLDIDFDILLGKGRACKLEEFFV